MPLTKADHEFYAKLYEYQKGKSQDFLKILSILIGFALLFFFLILLPYVNLQQKEVIARTALESIDPEIRENQRQINHYTGVQNGIKVLKEEIKDSPEQLKKYINDLSTFSEQTQQPLEIFPNCDNLNHTSVEFIRCNVNEKALSLITRYNITIFKNVINPLQANASQLFNLTSLRLKTQILMDSFRNISLTIDLSTSERNKLAASQSQEKQLDDYWSEFGSIIGREVNKINSTLLSLQSKKENLTLEKQQYASAKTNITHRLNEVQFPVGKIPLGINEAISLFPFGLIAGFVVCTALLYKSIVFRKRYHLDYVRQYDQSYHRTGKMISEELPIWIDPVSALYAQVLKSGVILIPFVIFLLSWSLIVQSWNFNNSAIAESILFGDVQTNRMIFNISNSIVFILFICCYVIIYIEWSNYRDDYLQHKIINSRA